MTTEAQAETKTTTCVECGATFPARTGEVAGRIYPKRACDACVAKSIQRTAAEKKRENRREAWALLTHLHDVTEETRAAGFSVSKAKYEAKNPEAWAVAKAWRPLTGSLFVSGPRGVGKSYMFRCCVKRAFWSGLTVADITGRHLLDTACSYSYEARADFERWKRCGVLLMDDLDKAPFTDLTLGALHEILDWRCNARLRTLITSNVPWDALLDSMLRGCPGNSSKTTATMDRLEPLTRLEMTGESLRKG